MNLLAYVTTIAFALSLIANAFNALKLDNSVLWLIYNFVQLTKAGIQVGILPISKIHLYILNNRSFICME